MPPKRVPSPKRCYVGMGRRNSGPKAKSGSRCYSPHSKIYKKLKEHEPCNYPQSVCLLDDSVWDHFSEVPTPRRRTPRAAPGPRPAKAPRVRVDRCERGGGLKDGKKGKICYGPDTTKFAHLHNENLGRPCDWPARYCRGKK